VQEAWRPVHAGDTSTLPFAPQTIVGLLDRCWHEDPAQRPDFTEIVAVLSGPCAVEVNSKPFSRRSFAHGKAEGNEALEVQPAPSSSSPSEEHERRRSDHLVRSSENFRPSTNPLNAKARRTSSNRSSPTSTTGQQGRATQQHVDGSTFARRRAQSFKTETDAVSFL